MVTMFLRPCICSYLGLEHSCLHTPLQWQPPGSISFPDLPRGGHHLPSAPSCLALPPHSTFRAELKVTVHLPLPCPASPNHETATF